MGKQATSLFYCKWEYTWGIMILLISYLNKNMQRHFLHTHNEPIHWLRFGYAGINIPHLYPMEVS